jgi:hypothetical protein
VNPLRSTLMLAVQDAAVRSPPHAIRNGANHESESRERRGGDDADTKLEGVALARTHCGCSALVCTPYDPPSIWQDPERFKENDVFMIITDYLQLKTYE